MNLKRLGEAGILSLFFSGCLLGAVRVRLPDGTPVPVRLKMDLRSNQVTPGDRVDFVVARPVVLDGIVLIPEGSIAWGAVQSVKVEKEIKFDVQGLRLPNLQEIKLRSVRAKTTNPGKDQIKLTSMLGVVVGARMGTEFMAYVDEDVTVEGTPQEAQPTSAQPAAAPAAKPAEVKPAGSGSAPAAPSTAPAATSGSATQASAGATAASSAPQVTTQVAEPAPPATQEIHRAPTAPGAQQAAQPAGPTTQEPAGTVERVTVECFSDPSGAEILIDGSFYGNTPSILKLTATSHHLEISMPGYRTFAQDLNLSADRGLRTIRAPLEKKLKE